MAFVALRLALASFDRAFVEGLRSGLRRGRNLAIDYRFGDNDLQRLERLADEIVASRPGVIVAAGPAIGAVARRLRAAHCAASGSGLDFRMIPSRMPCSTNEGGGSTIPTHLRRAPR